MVYRYISMCISFDSYTYLISKRVRSWVALLSFILFSLSLHIYTLHVFVNRFFYFFLEMIYRVCFVLYTLCVFLFSFIFIVAAFARFVVCMECCLFHSHIQNDRLFEWRCCCRFTYDELECSDSLNIVVIFIVFFFWFSQCIAHFFFRSFHSFLCVFYRISHSST